MSSSDSWFKRQTLFLGNFFFKYRNYLFFITFLILFLISKPILFSSHRFVNGFFEVAGICIALLGQAFRLAVIGYAYIKRGGKEGKVYADHLVVRGFFAHSRNPMYLGNILIVVGFSVLYSSLVAYLVVIPFFLYAYYSIVVAEETYLRARFGKEYEAYEKSVNRFIPNFKGLGVSLKDFNYDWKRALRKDYGTVFTTVLGIIAIDIWRTYSMGQKLGGFRAFAFTGVFVLLMIFYVISRTLKKSGYLASSN